MIMALFW